MPFAPGCCWAFQARATFFGDFWKLILGPPFALFQKMRALCDLSKIAITWPFGHFRRRFLLQHLFQSLHFKRILIKGYCYLRQSAFGPFERRLLFGWFFKNFPWSSLCTFSENAGFRWRCKNCHNLAIRELLEALFAPTFSPLFAL